MTKTKKKPLYAWICLVLTIILAISALVGFILSVWTNEGRWAMTSFIFLFPAIATGGIAGFGLSDI